MLIPTYNRWSRADRGPAKCRWKHMSRCKALGHCLDLCFTGASRVKTGEMPVWHRMSDFYPVFCKAPVTHRRFAGFHQYCDD
ncbi:hypothetical protein HAX54_045033 [Datura stramonium]|uniref:Uncharacterized protein n=1 Tax=Datura stramonium TaxID=4076 RepID=A0ABS8SRC5_DATST|nr:hypothetical protein [Datura stramonium]